MLRSFSHVTIRSSDLDRTEHFYASVLGLRTGFRPAFTQPGLWLYIGDEALVHVVTGQAQAAAGHIDHFAFNAQGLTAFADRLRGAAQDFRIKRLPGNADWQLFTHDPDGTLIEIVFPAQELFNEDSLP
jgi:catechol 2,3-dioxygenase-like lactoylglutathione lyase family enzyme